MIALVSQVAAAPLPGNPDHTNLTTPPLHEKRQAWNLIRS
ncbi:hypothetical protein Z947_3137 [Sulfitobacter geojensis]|nr:hypothetical protein Z947_3137 [Sulfitobacter geojensis]